MFMCVTLFQWQSWFSLMQAVAPTRQGDTSGRRRHGGQAAHNGGPQVEHPQVCPGGVRPSHHPPEQSQPQPGLRDLKLPVGGGRERTPHPVCTDSTATMHFSLVLKQQAHRVLLPAEFVFTPRVWRGCYGLQFITKPLASDAQSSGVCLRVLVVDVELQMWMKLPLGSTLLQSVSVNSLLKGGFLEVSAYSPPGCVLKLCV